MGLTLKMIDRMADEGLFRSCKTRLLDIGSSNLYQASASDILRFLHRYGVKDSQDLRDFAEKLSRGSAYDMLTGGKNEAFAGELFEKAGFTYHSIDIADGYRTTILDLNHHSTPKSFLAFFDIVINFGTTEHLLNQFNAFKVIHDSTKLGGYIVHSLPCIGYCNHGYFTYTPRCMFDLAGYNEYELVIFEFDGPGARNDLYAPIRDYSSYFPALIDTDRAKNRTAIGQLLQELNLPDVSLFIVYRKIKDKPFAGALEMTTSVGAIPDSVSSQYST